MSFVHVHAIVLMLGSVMRSTWAWSSSSSSTALSFHGSDSISPTFGGAFYSRRRIVVSSDMNDHDYNEEDDTIVDSPNELKKAIHNLSRRLPNRQSLDPNVAYYSVPNLEEALVAPTNTNHSTPLEGMKRQYPDYPGRVTGDDHDENVVDSDNLEGWFLDTDDYVNSRNYLNPDGSLALDSHSCVDEDYRILTEHLLRMQTPNVPSSLLQQHNDDSDEPTLESLWQQQQRRRSLDPTTAISEELHRKVFEHEQGYLDQSDIFRKSLTGDAAASLEATQWRRGADYRRRQQEALAKLYQEINDFETHYLKEEEQELRNNNKKKCCCFKCGCALSPQEIEHTNKASKRLCSICYSDLIVAKSDVSFVRDAPSFTPSPSSPPSFRQGTNRTAWRRTKEPSPRPYNHRSSNAAVASNVPNKPRVAPKMEQNDKPTTSNANDIEMLKQEIMALQEELHTLKQEELLTTTIPAQKAEEEATGPWSQVMDPDTGEVFYWNEETEEMKWEKEE